ncbi:hypothetical protein B0H13DRAFT_2353659 [Mycena leptocephala]|nr:hypothetical protein B0H13DRAFT_2353659 [Mycena leptocephala]
MQEPEGTDCGAEAARARPQLLRILPDTAPHLALAPPQQALPPVVAWAPSRPRSPSLRARAAYPYPVAHAFGLGAPPDSAPKCRAELYGNHMQPVHIPSATLSVTGLARPTSLFSGVDPCAVALPPDCHDYDHNPRPGTPNRPCWWTRGLECDTDTSSNSELMSPVSPSLSSSHHSNSNSHRHLHLHPHPHPHPHSSHSSSTYNGGTRVATHDAPSFLTAPKPTLLKQTVQARGMAFSTALDITHKAKADVKSELRWSGMWLTPQHMGGSSLISPQYTGGGVNPQYTSGSGIMLQYTGRSVNGRITPQFTGSSSLITGSLITPQHTGGSVGSVGSVGSPPLSPLSPYGYEARGFTSLPYSPSLGSAEAGEREPLGSAETEPLPGEREPLSPLSLRLLVEGQEHPHAHDDAVGGDGEGELTEEPGEMAEEEEEPIRVPPIVEAALPSPPPMEGDPLDQPVELHNDPMLPTPDSATSAHLRLDLALDVHWSAWAAEVVRVLHEGDLEAEASSTDPQRDEREDDLAADPHRPEREDKEDLTPLPNTLATHAFCAHLSTITEHSSFSSFSQTHSHSNSRSDTGRSPPGSAGWEGGFGLHFSIYSVYEKAMHGPVLSAGRANVYSEETKPRLTSRQDQFKARRLTRVEHMTQIHVGVLSELLSGFSTVYT